MLECCKVVHHNDTNTLRNGKLKHRISFLFIVYLFYVVHFFLTLTIRFQILKWILSTSFAFLKPHISDAFNMNKQMNIQFFQELLVEKSISSRVFHCLRTNSLFNRSVAIFISSERKERNLISDCSGVSVGLLLIDMDCR